MSPAFNLLHPGVQKAIWSMGWKEFHPIQVEAIRKVLGHSGHLIISAQTAGGKTEAAFLPIISKLAAIPSLPYRPSNRPVEGLDQRPVQKIGNAMPRPNIPVHRWHGDVSVSQKKEFRESPAGILLITPESLESNFINYGVQIPGCIATWSSS